MSENLLYQIAVSKIPLVGASKAKNLISYCGGVKEIFDARKSALLKIPGIGESIAQNILEQNVLHEAEREIRFLEKNDIRPLFYNNPNYPGRLRKYNDCPLMLFYKGTANLNTARIVGIIGTRKPTHQGISICEEIVEALVPYNVIILSGLAYGIDICAHKAALNSGQETIGVLGHGMKRIYPTAHRSIADKMAGQGGILTEFTSEKGPNRENFPMRNRIVAGLSDALIVVETEERGGSMITAARATNYGKQIFAVPGRIKDQYSAGCNELIRQNRATLLRSAEELAYTMHWQIEDGKEAALAKQARLFPDLSETEKQIIDLLNESEEMHIDALMRKGNFTGAVLSANLLTLEFQGLVKSLPGKCYMLS